MAGFAINVKKILEHREVKVGIERDGKPTRRGYLETSYLEHFASRETVHCLGTNREVCVGGRCVCVCVCVREREREKEIILCLCECVCVYMY